MAPAKKTRATANDPQMAAMDVNERILKAIQDIYSAQEEQASRHNSMNQDSPSDSIDISALKPKKEGIKAICEKLGLPCIPPRRKINVMIIGNHSAGKSTYINWYIDETIQSTAVAIETSGFTFVTSGKKRETLKGEATLHLYQDTLKGLNKFSGIVQGLCTEVCTSKEKRFNLINFIDSPGLVDGSFSYPFAVEDVIVWIADHCDLCFIFFDPIGQALCDRTMNVVTRLNENHADKIKYFLSKADTCPNESDRQKVVVQITQNLSSRVKNSHAFELPSLYIPNADGLERNFGLPSNALEDTCKMLEKSINQNVQNNLNQLKKDCQLVVEDIDKKIATHAVNKSDNRKAMMWGYLFQLLSSLVPLLAGLYVLYTYTDMLKPGGMIGGLQPNFTIGEYVGMGAAFVDKSWGDNGEHKWHIIGFTVGLFLFLAIASKFMRRYKPTLSKAQIRLLKETQAYVKQDLLKQQYDMYQEYFDQALHSQD